MTTDTPQSTATNTATIAGETQALRGNNPINETPETPGKRPAPFFRFQRKWLAIGLALILVGAFLLRPRATPVTFATARYGPLKLTIAASGKVDGDAGDLGFTGSGII